MKRIIDMTKEERKELFSSMTKKECYKMLAKEMKEVGRELQKEADIEINKIIDKM